MAIPDFEKIMLPLLRFIADGQEHTLREAIDGLASEFGLSAEEREALLPSGKQATFDNRVGWARTYMKKAGLVESTGRGRFRVTDRGQKVLVSSPSAIDVDFLMQFPEFAAFRRTPVRTALKDPATQAPVQTPEEVLENSYLTLREELALELLDRIRACSPRFFERLVLDLLVAMGYGGSRRDAVEAVGGSGDQGIDGVIKEDKLGLDVVYVQAKRWDGNVGRPVVQAFAGSLEGQRARKGILITTSQFTPEARDYVGRIEKKIVLIDGLMLAELMIDHGVGVAELATYVVKRIDTDYFE